jgi:hypothetical protein
MLHAPCALRFLICFTLHSLRLTPYAKLGFNFHLTLYYLEITLCPMRYALCFLKLTQPHPWYILCTKERREER